MQFRELRRLISNDFNFSRGKHKGVKNSILTIFFNPKFQLLFNYRLSVFLEKSSFGFLNIFIKYINLIIFSSEISPRAVIGKNFKIPHPIGLVIGDKVVIGNNVVIYQNVTIGAKSIGEGKYPILKDGVIVFANTTIVGGIEISKDITIGANSFVNKSCKQEGSTYAGLPVKKI